MDSFNGASWADRQIANIMFRRPEVVETRNAA
jgi:hypothetical protein